MSSTFGDCVKGTIFGESHGKSIGIVIDGLRAGLEIDEELISKELARRAPGQNSMGTMRKERDSYVIQSGIFNGKTTGGPICIMIANADTHSSDYSIMSQVMRPSHGDYPGYVKSGGCNDYRGGGSFSGRLTAPLVVLGALAKQCLAQEGIYVGSHIASIGSIEDRRFSLLGEEPALFETLQKEYLPVLEQTKALAMQEEILKAKEELDSVGGCIECMVVGLPVGLGEPYFDSVESRLAHLLFSIPAVKGVEFGAGFQLAQMRGSQANDAMYYEGNRVKCRSNYNGGVVGGLSNGMPLSLQVAIKPTPSIALKQETINIAQRQDTSLEIKGRHDPCIVPRAIPVVEAITAWSLLDLLYMSRRG